MAKALSQRAIAKRHAKTLTGPLEEYVTYLQSPHRVFWTNVLAGVARGVGAILGATVVIALLLFVLAQLAQVPHVGSYFRWVSEQIRQPG